MRQSRTFSHSIAKLTYTTHTEPATTCINIKYQTLTVSFAFIVCEYVNLAIYCCSCVCVIRFLSLFYFSCCISIDRWIGLRSARCTISPTHTIVQQGQRTHSTLIWNVAKSGRRLIFLPEIVSLLIFYSSSCGLHLCLCILLTRARACTPWPYFNCANHISENTSSVWSLLITCALLQRRAVCVIYIIDSVHCTFISSIKWQQNVYRQHKRDTNKMHCKAFAAVFLLALIDIVRSEGSVELKRRHTNCTAHRSVIDFVFSKKIQWNRKCFLFFFWFEFHFWHVVHLIFCNFIKIA